jgi:hypothetical protein
LKGYAKRVGAAFGDQMIGNMMTEGFMPALLHEDPRYFRIGEGSFGRRLWYAATRIIVTPTDSTTDLQLRRMGRKFGRRGISNLYYKDGRHWDDNAERLLVQCGTDSFVERIERVLARRQTQAVQEEKELAARSANFSQESPTHIRSINSVKMRLSLRVAAVFILGVLLAPAGRIPLQPPEDKRIFGVIPNNRTTEESIPFHSISAKQKITIAAKDSFDWPVFPTAAAFAGLYQIENQNPSFGQGVKGYALRFPPHMPTRLIGNIMTEGSSPSSLMKTRATFGAAKAPFSTALDLRSSRS